MSFLANLGILPSRNPADFVPARNSVPFIVGKRYSDGDVQRHIFSLHREFADSWRICGEFLCVAVNPSNIDESSYSIDDDVVAEYAGMIRCGSVPPPIVLDYDGDFIDGGHRHASAIMAGLTEIVALVQVEDIQDPPDDE